MYRNNLPVIKSHGGNMYSIGGNMFFMGGPQQPPNTTQSLTSSLSSMDPTGTMGAVAAISGVGTGLVNSINDDPTNILARGIGGIFDPLSGGPIGAMLKARKAGETQKLENNMASLAKGNTMMSGINSQTGNIYAADGGELPGITQFNEGGRHEQNPLNGVPQGISQQNGQPNLVEQGETKVKDFIYSDRLPVIGAREYNLPEKYEGKTFAAASKLASKYIKDRPNDPIAQKGQEVFLNRLKTANEEAKQMKDAAEQGLIPQEPQFCHGGRMKMKNVHATGGYLFTDY